MRPHSSITAGGIFSFLRRESTQLALLMLFCLGLGLEGLFQSPSIDEIGQIRVARGPVAAIPTRYSFGQNHPLYGILSHYAIRFLPLPTVLAARIPAVLAGLLLPWVFYRGRREWVGPEAAVLAAFLLVFVDPIKHYGTTARGYALMVLGALVLGDLLLVYLERGHPGLLAAYVAVAVATCYSHLWAFALLDGRMASFWSSRRCGRRQNDRDSRAWPAPRRPSRRRLHSRFWPTHP